MRRLLLFGAIITILFMGCNENSNPIDPNENNNGNGNNNNSKIIEIDAKNDCILLDNVTQIVNGLTSGQTYTVSVSGSNISAPMQGVFFMYAESSGKHSFKYVSLGQSFTFKPINSSFQIAPLYVDWSTTSDNSGQITVKIEGPTSKTINIDVKSNAILLDNYTTIVSDLNSSKSYSVSVSGSNITAPMQGMFFMYAEKSGSHKFRYTQIGSSFSFTPINGSYQLAPIYVDWSTTSDNSGKIKVEIK